MLKSGAARLTNVFWPYSDVFFVIVVTLVVVIAMVHGAEVGNR